MKETLLYATSLSLPREVNNGQEELLHHLLQFPGPAPRNVASCNHELLPHPAAMCLTLGSHARPFQNFLYPTYLCSLSFSVKEQYR